MASERIQAPSLRAIVKGLGLFAIGSVLIICNLANIVKIAGWVLLLVPQQLGMIESPAPKDIRTIYLLTPEHEISFTRPGPYLVYYEYPFATDNLAYGPNAPPYLDIACHGPSGQVPVRLIERGLRPYDTPFARGRPVYRFSLSGPDTCRFAYSAQQTSISVVPDYIAGKENVVATAYAVQLGVMFAVLCTPILIRVLTRRRLWREQRLQAVARAEAMRRALLPRDIGPKERL